MTDTKKETTVYEMRIAQFKAFGFYPLDAPEAVELLMEEPHTKTTDSTDRKNYDYHYRHNEHKLTHGDQCTWGVPEPTSYVCLESQGSWFLPPFSKKVKWTVEPVFKLDEFEAAIPDQMLVALNYMRTKGFFNIYHGFQIDGKGVLLGNVTELPPEASKSGDSTSFFIGLLGKR